MYAQHLHSTVLLLSMDGGRTWSAMAVCAQVTVCSEKSMLVWHHALLLVMPTVGKSVGTVALACCSQR